jgi:predicted RNase H-like nuclease (RuvC/YqgF family)
VGRNERTDIIASNIIERLEELIDLRERTEQLRLENSRLQQRAEALSELGERAIEVMSSLLPRMEELIQQRERTRELELENARLQQRLEEEGQRARQLRLQNLELQVRQREESGERTRLVILVIRNSRLRPEPTDLLNQRERREV